MKRQAYRPSVESLEDRCVPTTARLSGSLLSITGTQGSDHIRISLTGATIRVSGVVRSFPASAVRMLAINGRGGNDVIVIDQRLTMPAQVITGRGRDIVMAGGGPVSLRGSGRVTLIGGHPPALGLVGSHPPALGLVGGSQTSSRSPIIFAAINLSPQEQLMLELINRARANPAAEAARDHIDLNEGITSPSALAPQGTDAGGVLSSGGFTSGPISTDPKQPLAPNAALYRAAVEHSQDMLTRGYFDHYGPGGIGPSPQQRDLNDGYDSGYLPGYALAENIGYDPLNGKTQDQVVYLAHDELFVDHHNIEPGRGHRQNMMYPAFNEIGVGIRYGPFAPAQGSNTLVVTQDFGAGHRVYLTGVMYHDGNGNQFYDIGEGRPGATVQATNLATGQVYRTTTGTSGGYAMSLPAGNYSVTWASMSGGPRSVTIGSQNFKLDMLV